MTIIYPSIISQIFHWIGAGTLLLYAIASVAAPKVVAPSLEQGLSTGRSVSEFRVLHGGFLLGLSLFALATNTPLVYQALGWAWIGAAVIRLIAYVPDRPALNITIGAFIGELILGLFLLA